MDCFLLEGPKVLYRISLALVHLFIKGTFEIKKKSKKETVVLITEQQLINKPNYISMSSFCRISFVQLFV